MKDKDRILTKEIRLHLSFGQQHLITLDKNDSLIKSRHINGIRNPNFNYYLLKSSFSKFALFISCYFHQSTNFVKFK